MNMRHAGDATMIGNAMREVAGIAEEPIMIRRPTGNTTGDAAAGEADEPTYLDISTTASISELTAKDINFPGSIFAIGDLRIETRCELRGAESNATLGESAGRISDRVIYRGREYIIVGHPRPIYIDKYQYWQAELRQS